ncbi:MAG TPA: ethanolamine ammonia-lyase subunit EutC [Terracidiphilus sp.]|jgi:ethanolamine ammonia-lyase small subunit|nr:ethanolamine ammonia-lyase subunit EutC [Terracidiphilus sp.]
MTELTSPSWTTRLRALTPARVALGRTGVSQQTREQLDFQKAHALARDAVHARLQTAALVQSLRAVAGNEVLRLHSLAEDRAIYLQRPDLGRTLDEESRTTLEHAKSGSFELVVIVADGLSALAVERHAVPVLTALFPQLEGWKLAPVCVVEQGRVAIGDEIGAALGAQLSVVLIGERPGLSAPDSMGAYITWEPRPGRTDAERNCISNMRTEGLSYAQAAAQLSFYLREARRGRLTGVGLKGNSRLLGEG